MDRRREAYLRVSTKDPEVLSEEQKRLAQIIKDGTDGDFWQVLKPAIEGLILDAERRFVDLLAPDYATYVQWWGKRQALISVIALPDRLKEQSSLRSPHAT